MQPIEQKNNTSKYDGERYNRLMEEFTRSYAEVSACYLEGLQQYTAMRGLLGKAASLQMEFNVFFDIETKQKLVKLRSDALIKTRNNVVVEVWEHPEVDPQKLIVALNSILLYCDELVSEIKKTNYKKQQIGGGIYD
jgi:hypothetical protein